MKQEEKELLIKDICARLPYNVVVHIDDCGIWNLRGIDHDDSAELRDRVIVWHGKNYPSSKNSFPIMNCKPYLFPLSSMTDEQRKELEELGLGYYVTCQDIDDDGYMWDEKVFQMIPTTEIDDWMNAHHFDYRGLIEKGLALDATNLNIY